MNSWWVSMIALAVTLAMLAHWPTERRTPIVSRDPVVPETVLNADAFQLDAWERRFHAIEKHQSEERAELNIELIRFMATLSIEELGRIIEQTQTSAKSGDLDGDYDKLAFLLMIEKDPLRALEHPLSDPLQQGQLGKHWSSRREAFNELARTDLPAARMWLKENHATVDNDLGVMVASVTLEIARSAPEELKAWFAETRSYQVYAGPGGLIDNPMHLLNADARLAFYNELCAFDDQTISEQAGESLMAATLTMEGFDAAIDLYERLPMESALRQQALVRLIAEAGRVAPERGSEWLLESGTDSEIDRLLPSLMLSWANMGNLDTAEQRLESLDPGPLRDKVVASFVKGAVERDLYRSLRWAEKIEDEEQREAAVRLSRFRHEHR